MDKQPQGTKKWSLLTPKQQTQLKYQRAKWRATRLMAYMNFAREVKRAREARGLSQAEMAKQLRVCLRTFKRYEAGQSISEKVLKWLSKQG